MKLRLKLFIVTAALLTLFTLLSLSADCRNTVAQEPSDTVKVTFVEIGAARCIPCKAMQPIMKEVAAQCCFSRCLDGKRENRRHEVQHSVDPHASFSG